MTVAGRVGDGNSLYILFSRRGHFVGTVLFCVYVDDITFLKRYPALSVFGLDSACFQQCRLRRSPASAGQVTFSGSTQPSVVAGSSRTRRLPLPVDLAPATFRTFWRLQVALGPTHAPHKARLRRRFLFPSNLKQSQVVSGLRHRSVALVLAASSFGSASASVSSGPLGTSRQLLVPGTFQQCLGSGNALGLWPLTLFRPVWLRVERSFS